MRYHYKGVNANKLHQELIDEGIVPQLVESREDEAWITTDVDKKLVDAVVDKHDPSPIPQPPTLEEQIEDLKRRVAELEGELGEVRK